MITVVQSDPDVPSGTIAGCLSSRHIPYRTVRVFAGEPLPLPASSSAVIVLGGSMGVHDIEQFPFLLTVKDYVRAVVANCIPLLGICLGGQLLADALGSQVNTGRFGERGTQAVRLHAAALADPLFLGIPEEFQTFQWHDDSFELPEAATLLAGSTACANQVFRFGSTAYGLQFHPEVTREIVAAWSESSPEGPGGSGIVVEYLRFEEHYRAISGKLLKNFLHIAGLAAG